MFELGKGLVAGLATEGTRTMTFTWKCLGKEEGDILKS